MEGSDANCSFCGEEFLHPGEDDDIGRGVPQVLTCGHVLCTVCLQAVQHGGFIISPECEVESNVPEVAVQTPQEDRRSPGLVDTAKQKNLQRRSANNHNKLPILGDMDDDTEDMEQSPDMEKIDKTLDQVLARAALNLTKLEQIHETLATGREEQIERERVWLEREIQKMVDKASQAVENWRDGQLSQLSNLDEHFPTSQEQLCCIQEKLKTLKIAIQWAREVRRSPFLKQNCALDKVMETLQGFDSQSFDMECISLGSGLSYVFHLKDQNQTLSLSLKMEVAPPMSPHRLSKPEKPNQEKPVANQAFADVIIEEVIEEPEEHALPPTGPELAKSKSRSFWKRRNRITKIKNTLMLCSSIVSTWVVVTSIVHPSHFYVQYLAEAGENLALSKKIDCFCSKESSFFTSKDIVETGSMIFVKWKEGLWCRANVLKVFQKGFTEAVKCCPAYQLASVQVFCIDSGSTETVTIETEAQLELRSEEATELFVSTVNKHMRKVEEAERVQLHSIAPLAIRCALKNLVPYSLAEGWTKKSQVEFQKLVGSSALDMKILGQDKDSLLVDLMKIPVGQSCDTPLSVRQCLVFTDVARFYAPVVLEKKPPMFYHPVYPQADVEFNAVVSHINSPADFYIQVVENMDLALLSAQLQYCYNAAAVTDADDLMVYCPVIGQAYVACGDDNLWYRVQVIGHPGDGQVEIFYVDLGNKTIAPVTDLRRVKDEFFALPIRAIQCCLEEIVPCDGRTWGDSCTERFISLAHQKVVTVVSVHSEANGEPLPVLMFESDLNGPKANMAELLVKEGLACLKRGSMTNQALSSGSESIVWDPPLNPGLAASDVDSTNHKTTVEDKEELLSPELTLKLPAQLKDLRVSVSHVNSPSSFYVQLTQDHSQLRRVCELLKKCALLETPDGFVWRADMYCAADINGVWERGRICSDLTPSNIAEVMRCDYGNMVKLHISSLRPLPPPLIGSLALQCSLTDIRPAGGQATWTATACDLFSCYLTGASAVMTIKEEMKDLCPVPVTLSHCNEMGQVVSMADLLISKGLALRERKPRDAAVVKAKDVSSQSPVMEAQADDTRNFGSAVAKLPLPSQISAPSARARLKLVPRTIVAEKVKTKPYPLPEMPHLGQIQVRVAAVGDDGLIYMRTHEAERQFKQLMETVGQSMKTFPKPSSYEWKWVQGCAVMGSDMLWYRGEVVEVLGEYVKVQYVDYGLVENIPAIHICPVLLCEDVPQLCVPCKLHRSKPFGGKWQLDAVALLKELLINRTVDVDVKELPSDSRAALSAEVFIDGMSLNTILSFHNHASVDDSGSVPKALSVTSPSSLDEWDLDTEGLMDPVEPFLGPFLSPDIPPKGAQFQARVRHLCTPNQLFLMPLDGTADLEVDGETLHDALRRVNADISNLPQLTCFFQDYPCLAEYSDGLYYRAKITKFVSLEPVGIMVHHVDFGSDDTLPTSKIRQIPAELLKFPVEVLRVKVAGFKPRSISRKEDMLPYCPEWSLQATMEMFDLLQTSTRASVVACEPELAVLLYDRHGELLHLPLIRKGLAEQD